jgi:GntR family histidine utilization transcriptional repressor
MSDRKPAPARRNVVARHTRIRQTLETAIVSGAWPPGARVTSEQELLKRYGCSRMTVNKALSALAASGLIVRRRRSGSFVATPKAETNVLHIQNTEEEVRRAGKSYGLTLLSRSERKASKRDTARLDVAVGARVLAVKCVHSADGHPVVVEDRLINLEAVSAAADVDFETTSPGTWLLHEVPWSQAEHQIRAVNASAEIAKHLGIRIGDACLEVERRTRYSNRPITHVVLSYPGSEYRLVARFSPSG